MSAVGKCAQHLVIVLDAQCAADTCLAHEDTGDYDASADTMTVVVPLTRSGNPDTSADPQMFHTKCWELYQQTEHKSALERINTPYHGDADLVNYTLNPTIVLLTKFYLQHLVGIAPARGFLPTTVGDEGAPFVMTLDSLDVAVDRFMSIRDISTSLCTLQVRFSKDPHMNSRELAACVRSFLREQATLSKNYDITWWIANSARGDHKFDVIIYDRSVWARAAKYDEAIHGDSGITWADVLPGEHQKDRISKDAAKSRKLIDHLVAWITSACSKKNHRVTVEIEAMMTPTTVQVHESETSAGGEEFSIFRQCTQIMSSGTQQMYGVLDNHVGSPELLLYSGKLNAHGPVPFFIRSNQLLADIAPSKFTILHAQVLDHGNTKKTQ